jgi:hypothetical protein
MLNFDSCFIESINRAQVTFGILEILVAPDN